MDDDVDAVDEIDVSVEYDDEHDDAVVEVSPPQVAQEVRGLRSTLLPPVASTGAASQDRAARRKRRALAKIRETRADMQTLLSLYAAPSIPGVDTPEGAYLLCMLW